MDLDDAIGFIQHLMQKRYEDRMFFRWVVSGAHTEIGFDMFKARLTPQKVRSDEEILAEVYEIFEKAGIK